MAIPTNKIEPVQATDFTFAKGVGREIVIDEGPDDIDLTVQTVDGVVVDMGPTTAIEFVTAGTYHFMDAFGVESTWTTVAAGESYALRLLGIYKAGTTALAKIRIQW